jgi:hypothetical protein
MRKVAVLTLMLGVSAAGAAVNPALALFDYEGRELPVAGDCAVIASEIGAQATWHGEFSGKRYDDFRELYTPFFAEGCFRSEYECRRWQNVATSYMARGGIVYTRCTLGVRGGT